MADISLQYLDQPLNTVSVGYKNDDYFAEQLFPLVPVKKQSGRYWVSGEKGSGSMRPSATQGRRPVRSHPGRSQITHTSVTTTA